MNSNVIEASNKFVAPSSKDTYNRFIVINWHTKALLVMSDEALIENASYRPVNFIEFLEMHNHGKFDDMDEPHLVVLQSNGERTIMAIVIAPSVQ
jgi:hypothetical protein